MDQATLRRVSEDVLPDIVAIRRDIHAQPELGLDTPITQQRILDTLDGQGFEIATGSGLTSVVADRGDPTGPTILLRADTDALPLTEESGEDFSSRTPGRAHACGHDAHVAMLLGAARVIAQHDLPRTGRIRLSFQPGEEGHAGAGVMIDEGLLDGVDAAFALHVSPNIPAGFLASRPGPLLASSDEFHVTVVGRGGHASTPHFGNDPIPVACEMVTAFQTAVTRRINAFDPAVLTVARITAGTTTNVIPERAEVEGTLRAVSEATRAAVHEEVDRIARHVAAAHDCSAEVELRPGYPVTVNDAPFARWVAEVAEAQLGPGRCFELPTPAMGAEDFSYLLQEVPGAMAFLGVCPTDIPNSLDAPGCHSNRMRIDEDAMAVGVEMHVAVATAYLDRHA